MNKKLVWSLCAVVALVGGGLALSAQQPGGPVMSAPPRASGASVTPAFEGWFDSPDGSHNFLIGYYNRNTQEEIDIPIGPNNRFDSTPDMGQPTHFLTRRRYGFFIATVPKEFSKTQKISWTLTVNGVTSTVPFLLHRDYNISPLKASEESRNHEFNRPPVLRFADLGPRVTGPMATALKPFIERKATAGQPMPLDIFAEDDALSGSASGSAVREGEVPVRLEITKYRGPGDVTVKDDPKLTTTIGGKPMEPYAGKASPTINFSAAGDYMLHVHALDYSGKGGATSGGAGCCWTTAIVKVSVSPANGTSGN